MSQKITVKFLGAAGTVTGSKYLISALNKNILVDCGMFQGIKKLRLLNWENLPVYGGDIDIILLTHGHLDHTGYLPRIVKDGFRGKIMATGPTFQVAKIILEDSARIHEEDTDKANRGGYSKHRPAKPLYDLKDVERTLELFNPQPEGEWLKLSDGIRVRFNYVGHIIGATFIELEINGKILVFSGDVGRENDILLNPPKKPEIANVVFIESTYGDRLHPENSLEELIRVVNETFERKGTLIIPSFAVERTQAIMYLLYNLQNENLIPNMPLYLDSPMGNNVLKVFKDNPEWHKLTPEIISTISERIKYIKSLKETFRLISDKSPKIVIAGSGMGTGGRVLSYFETYLGEKSSTILLVGYQAEGTRGRLLLDGIKEIKIKGKYYMVKAKVENIQGLSAHADQSELVNWLKNIKNTPEHIFIVHGEPQAADALRLKIKDNFDWDCIIPALYDSYDLF